MIKRLSDVSAKALLGWRRAGERSTAKFIITDEEGRILVVTSGKDKKHGFEKANLPGGGVEGDDAIVCALREIAEELYRLRFSRGALRKARFLVEGRVKTGKTGWDFKHLMIFHLKVKSLKGVKTDGRELGRVYLCENKKEARKVLLSLHHTRRDVLQLYLMALKRL